MPDWQSVAHVIPWRHTGSRRTWSASRARGAGGRKCETPLEPEAWSSDRKLRMLASRA